MLVDKQKLFHFGVQQTLEPIDDIILIDMVPDIADFNRYRETFQPDVIVVALNILDSLNSSSLKDGLKALHLRKAILILVDILDEGGLHELIGEFIDGIVSRYDSADLFIEAIRSVAAGQIWLSPRIQQILLQSSNEEDCTLTSRELEVLELIVVEKADKEIAQLLGIAPRTVRFHLENIHIKLGTATRTGAAVEAVRRNLIS